MKLIDDWRKAWRFHSMRASAAGLILTSLGASLALAGGAAAWVTVLDMGYVLLLAAVIFLASMIGRLISQSHDTDK